MNPSQELINYIIESRAVGMLDPQITANLQNAGWSIENIQAAFQSLSQNSPQEYKNASLWSRYWASVIDGIFINLPAFFVVVLYMIITKDFKVERSIELNAVLIIIGIFFSIGYNVYFLSKKGTTIGKDAYGLAVVDFHSKQKITLSQIRKREIWKFFLSILPIVNLINMLAVVFSPTKQGIHDRIANTLVVKVKKHWELKRQLGCAGIVIVLFMIPFILLVIFSAATSGR